MNIKHYPITKVEQVEKFYSEKDQTQVKYVCTTEFEDNVIADVFYRETPHPEFGNKYFGLYFKVSPNKQYDRLMIFDADKIEHLTFGMIKNDDGDLEYSRSRHDYKSFDNGNMIDGGRDYIRSSGSVKTFVVTNGEFIG